MIRRFKNKFFPLFSNDIGVDLGTANTLVYLRGKGIVVQEPSVVAVNQKTGQVVAVGTAAKAMLGRTPAHLVAVKPLVDGVVSDFEATEEMLAYLMTRAQGVSKKMLGPRVRLPIREAVGSMIVDIGGGNTDIAVLSLGGIVRSKNLRIAGEKLNQDIIAYVRSEFKILIGEKTAEAVKIAIGSVSEGAGQLEAPIRGRDLITGLPREVMLTDSDIREAISQSIDTLVESVREVLETTPPEILSDIMRGGIVLVGGWALLGGLDALLEEWLKVPVVVAEDPLTAVARGTGVILENFELHRDMLTDDDDTK